MYKKYEDSLDKEFPWNEKEILRFTRVMLGRYSKYKVEIL